MSLHLDFLNKNMFRKYPIASDMSCIDVDGKELPQDLITSMQITADISDFADPVYISKVYIKNSYISVVVSRQNTALGCFSGKITTHFQSIKLTPFLPTVSGTMTVGKLGSIQTVNDLFVLTDETAALEDSVIFKFTPPGLTSFNGITTGHVSLIGDNISLAVVDNDIELQVIDINKILSRNDINGANDTCLTPIITHLNTVPPDINGNIDIFGIDPVTIEVTVLESSVTIEPNLVLDDVCPERNPLQPPANDSDNYYSDILTTISPEWLNWDQFN